MKRKYIRSNPLHVYEIYWFRAGLDNDKMDFMRPTRLGSVFFFLQFARSYLVVINFIISNKANPEFDTGTFDNFDCKHRDSYNPIMIGDFIVFGFLNSLIYSMIRQNITEYQSGTTLWKIVSTAGSYLDVHYDIYVLVISKSYYEISKLIKKPGDFQDQLK